MMETYGEGYGVIRIPGVGVGDTGVIICHSGFYMCVFALICVCISTLVVVFVSVLEWVSLLACIIGGVLYL